MTRDTLSLAVADLSAFSRIPSRQLAETAALPSHLTVMNMLAHAQGFRNLQHLKSAQTAAARLAALPAVQDAVDHTLEARALVHFDAEARLRQWPARRIVQMLGLWALWARLPAAHPMTERQISTALDALHCFGDATILRHDMVALGLFSRISGGSVCLHQEQPPPPEALALIRHLSARHTTASESAAPA